MKKMGIMLIAMALLMAAVVLYKPPPEKYVAGHLYIRARGISAEVYTSEAEPMDGMSSLWNGGKVTVKADLSAVQLGDMADIYTVEGEHLVLECIEIRKGLWWLRKPRGDVLVVNNKYVYRFTRL